MNKKGGLENPPFFLYFINFETQSLSIFLRLLFL